MWSQEPSVGGWLGMAIDEEGKLKMLDGDVAIFVWNACAMVQMWLSLDWGRSLTW